MGLVGETAKYIETGISALRPGGTIHYHQTVPSWLFPFALEGKVMSAAKRLGRDAEILQTLRVKKYSPGVVHGVVDARIN
jgi:tRNA wybutosine-synthesizing protein 2